MWYKLKNVVVFFKELRTYYNCVYCNGTTFFYVFGITGHRVWNFLAGLRLEV